LIYLADAATNSQSWQIIYRQAHAPYKVIYRTFRHLQAALPLPVGMAAFLARLCTLQFTVVIQLCPQTNAIRFECKYVFAHCSAHLYLQFAPWVFRSSRRLRSPSLIYATIGLHTLAARKIYRKYIYGRANLSHTMAASSRFLQFICFGSCFDQLLKYLRLRDYICGMHTVNSLNSTRISKHF